MGAAGDEDSEREKKGRKFVDFAITTALAFNRREFAVRRGSIVLAD